VTASLARRRDRPRSLSPSILRMDRDMARVSRYGQNQFGDRPPCNLNR
jgi:hypothetical protein